MGERGRSGITPKQRKDFYNRFMQAVVEIGRREVIMTVDAMLKNAGASIEHEPVEGPTRRAGL
jgi:hypothetical protein